MYDTLELLRPKLHIYASWDEASQAAEALDKEFASKLGELLGHLACLVCDDDFDVKVKVPVLIIELILDSRQSACR